MVRSRKLRGVQVVGIQALVGLLIWEALKNVETKGGGKIAINGNMVDMPALPQDDAYYLLTSRDTEMVIAFPENSEEAYRQTLERVYKSFGYQDLKKRLLCDDLEAQEMKMTLRVLGVEIR